MKKIKLCHFIKGFHNGGVEKVIENYFSNMDRSEFELHIVTHMEPDLRRQKVFEDMGFHVHQLTHVHGHKIKVQNIKEYAELFNSNDFDIVHNHFPENLLPLFFAKRKKIPGRILHSHNDYENAFSKKSALKKILYDAGLRFSVWQATHYFACGTKAAETVYGKNKMSEVYLINNAIDTTRFKYDELKRQQMREKLGMKNSFVLGHVGRYEVEGQKNQTFVLEIFREVLKKDSEAKLLMLGEGETRLEIMKRAELMGISQNIIFTGAVPNVSDFLQAMDVFVFPSLHEGLSVVSIEAQCAGLPIIASDTVSKESAVTNLFSSVSLKESAEHWANEVLSKKMIFRQDQSKILRESGYEIREEAKKLQKIYENIAFNKGTHL